MPPATRQTASQTARKPVTEMGFRQFSENLLDSLFSLHAEHGPIAAVQEGTQQIVTLFDPEFNRQVLSDTKTFEARFFSLRGPKTSSQRRVTCGLLAMNGQQHRKNRRLLKEPFGLRAIASYRPTIQHLIDLQMATWHDGQSVDLNDEMTRFMLGVTSTLLFGLDDYDEAYELGELIAEWVTLNHQIGIGAMVPLPNFSHRYDELLSTAERLESAVRRMIERRRRNPKPDGDIISLLLQHFGGDDGLSDEELVGQTCVIFAAAHMTTAHSLTWTLLLLAQHPHVARQLWGELDYGDRGTATAAGNELSLIDRIIKESMRVLPASAYSQRITAKGVQLGPFDLPRGTPILFTPLITHRLENLYPNPRRFDPDRWIDLRPGPYEYIPFGGGSRMCIGGPLALEIIRAAIPRFLSEFRFELEPGTAINAEVKSTMFQPCGGVPVTLRRAGEEFASVPLGGNLAELVDFPTPERLAAVPRKPR